MKHFATMGIAALVVAAGSAAAGITFQESFENAPGTTYTMSNQFDDGFFDFFDRYAVPDNSNAARDDFQLGWDGGFGILGQDNDGDGFASTQSVFISGIDISGQSNISVVGSFGALNSEPNFNNYESSQGDGFKIYASIDGAGRTLIGEFAPNSTGASDLYLDTNGDGVGDGTRLTVDLADFSFGVAGTGSVLDIEVAMTSTGSFEPLAIDNIRVDAVPAPGSLALLGFAGLVATRRRR